AAGGTGPCVLNAANEIAVHAFLAGRLTFTAIPEVIAAALDELGSETVRAFETLFEADRHAREHARREVASRASAPSAR
ncbi:MAG: 1-deoxy-D-xylulose-5-phosphate reductoisomerase, partial [Solirubrobacteraceae bacterium]|nr:1-deoxy-D-xylulose-5-phosphate reductoisomerase [Solirubrobacteraceae bacterium]